MARVIVVLDEAIHGLFEVARQVVVFQQNSVLQGLMPAFDLTLGLRMVRRAAHMVHAVALEPLGEIAGDVARTVVTQQPRLVHDARGTAA